MGTNGFVQAEDVLKPEYQDYAVGPCASQLISVVDQLTFFFSFPFLDLYFLPLLGFFAQQLCIIIMFVFVFELFLFLLLYVT
jgi:hypothetical protein